MVSAVLCSEVADSKILCSELHCLQRELQAFTATALPELCSLPHLAFSVDVDSRARVGDAVVVKHTRADVGLQVQQVSTRNCKLPLRTLL
jgi:hypothetical protein